VRRPAGSIRPSHIDHAFQSARISLLTCGSHKTCLASLYGMRQTPRGYPSVATMFSIRAVKSRPGSRCRCDSSPRDQLCGPQVRIVASQAVVKQPCLRRKRWRFSQFRSRDGGDWLPGKLLHGLIQLVVTVVSTTPGHDALPSSRPRQFCHHCNSRPST